MSETPQDDATEASVRRRYAWGGGIVGLLLLVAAVVALPLVQSPPEETGSAMRGPDAGDANARDGDAASTAAAMRVESVDAIDLTGTWAHKSVQTSLTDIPIAGEVEAKSISVRITTVEQEGEEVTLRTKLCDTRLESNFDRVQTEFSEAFVETAPKTVRHGTLERRDGGLHLAVARNCGVRGADVDDPAEGELPTQLSDKRVTDGDSDGNPGVTIRVDGMVSGKMYLVQRGCDSFRGRVISPDRIRGTVDWSTEQKLLEATSMWLSAPNAKPHPKASKSWFEMRRLESDSATCNDVM